MPLQSFTPKTDYGLVRVTTFRTLVHELGNGYEQRVSKSTGALHRYRLVFKERLTSELKSAMYDFYVARKGRLEAFNITDPFDGSTKKVRFAEDALEEEFFYTLLESARLEVQEVV